MVIDSKAVQQVNTRASYTTAIPVILLIEDNTEHLKLLSDMLSQAGYRVHPTRTGRAGLRAAHLLYPDLILLDVKLPDQDGFEVCRTLKADPRLGGIPVIFISGLTDVKSQVTGFEVGGRDYIFKPFEKVIVMARIRSQLDIQRLQKQQREHIQLQERHRIARDLHDSVNQTLFILGTTAQKIMLTKTPIDEALVENLTSVNQLSQLAIDEMRMLLFELQPETLLQTPFVDLLIRLIRSLDGRTEAKFSIDVQDEHDEIDKNPDQKIAIYHIMREGIFNAIKHANAKQINIKISCSKHDRYLCVTDDGVGFDIASTASSGMGLLNMQERALEARLQFNMESTINEGTHIKVSWATWE